MGAVVGLALHLILLQPGISEPLKALTLPIRVNPFL
jgi:hypothetical protein